MPSTRLRPPCWNGPQNAGRATHAIGKIGDIFSDEGRGELKENPTLIFRSFGPSLAMQRMDLLILPTLLNLTAFMAIPAMLRAMPARWNGSTPAPGPFCRE